MQRNNNIVNRAFRNFLLASILTSVVQQLRVLVDGVIVGHLIGPMALSAINLYLPLEETVYGIIMLFTAGAAFLAAGRQSQHDYEGVSSQFFVAMSSGLNVVIVLITLAYIFFPELIDLLSDADSPELYDYTAEYTKVLLISFLIQVPNSVLRSFISIDGQPQIVTHSICVSFVLNILLDLIFVGMLDMGIAGAAWATLTSDMVGLFILLPYVTGRQCSFALTTVNHYAAELRESLQQGLPLALECIMYGMVIMITNQVVLEFEGANGVFVFAVVFQILAICGMVTEGLGEINESIGGVLLGEGDNAAFRALVHKSYHMLWCVLAGISLLIFIFPEYFMMLFGAETEQMTTENISAMCIVSLLLVPYVVTSFNACIHTLVEHGVLSIAMLLMQAGVLVCAPYVITAIDNSLFWYSFPIGSVFVAGIQMIASYLIYRQKRQTTRIALLPTLPDSVSMDYSLPYDDSVIDSSLRDAALFLNVCELEVQQRADLFVCCTDIANNILAHSSDNNKGHYFDLRIQDEEDVIEIWFKDSGMPYNPAQEITPPENVEMSHKYMFGLNVTTLRIKKKQVYD